MRMHLPNYFIFVLPVAVLVLLLTGLFFVLPVPVSSFRPGALALPANPVGRENMEQGTLGWLIPSHYQASTQIQAYASASSVAAGSSIEFFVSTLTEGTPYSIAIYRAGWYAGTGGRLLRLIPDLPGHAQGYYNEHQLTGCRTCHVDALTGLVEAGWRSSYRLSIPSTWTSGLYLAKFVDVHGFQTYVHFDVTGNLSSTYIVVTPDTTLQAYNTWGGYSLFSSDTATVQGLAGTVIPHAVKVSFDRPYSDMINQMLQTELNAVHWLERQGYNLSYISSVDLHKDPRQILHHRALLSLGLDMFWTKEMRSGLDVARDHGVGLAFLGASAGTWQMRFEPDSAGHAERVIVCYQVSSVQNDLARDPFYGSDNSRVTAMWRDPLLGHPESDLVGSVYAGMTRAGDAYPWRISMRAAGSELLQGTPLQPGRSYGCALVGPTWDHLPDSTSSTPPVHLLSASMIKTRQGANAVSQGTYYRARSGALVFTAGGAYLLQALDDYRMATDPHCVHQPLIVPAIQQFMQHLMALLIIRHQ